MSVEMVFQDTDADCVVLHLFRAFACHSGLAPGIRAGRQEERRAIQLKLDPANSVRSPFSRAGGQSRHLDDEPFLLQDLGDGLTRLSA
jgi:hypothetical protein